MTQEEIVRELVNYLEQHLSGVRGSMDQEPYKGDFFRLFKEAFQQGYFDSGRPILTAGALIDILATRWLTGDSQDELKEELIDSLYTKWAEWRYAWEHYESAD